jgi:hypothetical protein
VQRKARARRAIHADCEAEARIAHTLDRAAARALLGDRILFLAAMPFASAFDESSRLPSATVKRKQR